MKIVVGQINTIKPKLLRGGNRIEINVDITPYQMADLFYTLWEYLEDDKLRELIEAENYKLVKNK